MSSSSSPGLTWPFENFTRFLSHYFTDFEGPCWTAIGLAALQSHGRQFIVLIVVENRRLVLKPQRRSRDPPQDVLESSPRPVFRRVVVQAGLTVAVRLCRQTHTRQGNVAAAGLHICFVLDLDAIQLGGSVPYHRVVLFLEEIWSGMIRGLFGKADAPSSCGWQTGGDRRRRGRPGFLLFGILGDGWDRIIVATPVANDRQNVF